MAKIVAVFDSREVDLGGSGAGVLGGALLQLLGGNQVLYDLVIKLSGLDDRYVIRLPILDDHLRLGGEITVEVAKGILVHFAVGDLVDIQDAEVGVRYVEEGVRAKLFMLIRVASEKLNEVAATISDLSSQLEEL